MIIWKPSGVLHGQSSFKDGRKANEISVGFLDDLQTSWNEIMFYFQTLAKTHPGFRYRELVGAHIVQAVQCSDLVDGAFEGEEKRD